MSIVKTKDGEMRGRGEREKRNESHYKSDDNGLQIFSEVVDPGDDGNPQGKP